MANEAKMNDDSQDQEHVYNRHRLAAISVLVGMAILAVAFVWSLRILYPPPADIPAEWVPCRDVLLDENAWTDTTCPHPEHRIHYEYGEYVCKCYMPEELGMPVVKNP